MSRPDSALAEPENVVSQHRQDACWAAGLLDGRARIGRFKPLVSVSHWHLPILARLKAILGVGEIYGPYKPKRGGSREYWNWQCYGSANLDLIVLKLHTYLSEMTEKALLEGRTIVEVADQQVTPVPWYDSYEGRLDQRREAEAMSESRGKEWIDPRWRVGYSDEVYDGD